MPSPSTQGRAVVGHPASSAPARAWYAFGILLLTTIFAVLGARLLNLVTPSLQVSLGLSDLQLGALQGLGIALFSGIAGYPIGWLADRYGRRLLLVMGVVVWSLSTAACAFQYSFTGLWLATIGLAVGEAGLIPIVFAILPDLFVGSQRVAANYMYFAASSIGTAVAAGLGGLLLRWLATHQSELPAIFIGMEPWRLAMLAAALPAPVFVLLIATIPTVRSASVVSADVHSTNDAAAASFMPFARRHWRTLGGLFGAIFGYNLPLGTAFLWLPVILSRLFAIQPAAAGPMIGGAGLIAGVLGVVLPAIAIRLRSSDTLQKPLRNARLFALMALVTTALLPFTVTYRQILILACGQLALGLSMAANMPGVIQDISPPPLRSRILSLVTIVAFLATAVASLSVGGLSGMLATPRGILTAATLVCLAGWLISLGMITLVIRPLAITVQEVLDSSLISAREEQQNFAGGHAPAIVEGASHGQ